MFQMRVNNKCLCKANENEINIYRKFSNDALLQGEIFLKGSNDKA